VKTMPARAAVAPRNGDIPTGRPDNQRHSPVSAAGWRKIAVWGIWVEG
jgi:hypothetical protein